MGASFPSSRAQSQANQRAQVRISAIARAQSSRGNLDPRSQFKIQNLLEASRRGGLSSLEILKQFDAPLPFEVAQKRAEQQFKQTQAKAESDFLNKIQSAIDKQLGSFSTSIDKQLSDFAPSFQGKQVPIGQRIVNTPMIESESQMKQTEQSPISLIPIAIIGIILGAVLLG